METFLYIVFFLSCIVMVGSVLLQPGKTDAGALFTSGVSSAAMNPRGTASVLSKLTIITATIFMLSALMLSLPALTGKVSVLQTQGENAPAITDTNTNANANTADVNANSNADASATNSSTDNSETKTDEKKEESTEEKSDKPAAETKVESKDKADEKKEENK